MRILRIDLDPQILVPAEKITPQNKTLQKLAPFSQVENSAFNFGLVPLGNTMQWSVNIGCVKPHYCINERVFCRVW